MPPDNNKANVVIFEHVLNRIKQYLTLATSIIGLIIGLIALNGFKDPQYKYLVTL